MAKSCANLVADILIKKLMDIELAAYFDDREDWAVKYDVQKIANSIALVTRCMHEATEIWVNAQLVLSYEIQNSQEPLARVRRQYRSSIRLMLMKLKVWTEL